MNKVILSENSHGYKDTIVFGYGSDVFFLNGCTLMKITDLDEVCTIHEVKNCHKEEVLRMASLLEGTLNNDDLLEVLGVDIHKFINIFDINEVPISLVSVKDRKFGSYVDDVKIVCPDSITNFYERVSDLNEETKNIIGLNLITFIVGVVRNRYVPEKTIIKIVTDYYNYFLVNNLNELYKEIIESGADVHNVVRVLFVMEGLGLITDVITLLDPIMCNENNEEDEYSCYTGETLNIPNLSKEVVSKLDVFSIVIDCHMNLYEKFFIGMFISTNINQCDHLLENIMDVPGLSNKNKLIFIDYIETTCGFCNASQLRDEINITYMRENFQDWEQLLNCSAIRLGETFYELLTYEEFTKITNDILGLDYCETLSKLSEKTFKEVVGKDKEKVNNLLFTRRLHHSPMPEVFRKLLTVLTEDDFEYFLENICHSIIKESESYSHYSFTMLNDVDILKLVKQVKGKLSVDYIVTMLSHFYRKNKHILSVNRESFIEIMETYPKVKIGEGTRHHYINKNRGNSSYMVRDIVDIDV